MSIRTTFALMLFVTAAAAGDPATPPDCATTSRVELRYSPGGECTNAIVSEIDKAKTKVLVLAYSFTSEPITQALARAKSRGLEVQAIIDSDRLFENGGCAKALSDNEINVYGDAAHSIQHQKVIIIDPDKEDSVLLLGSFNFTAAAEFHNSEDLAVLRSHELSVTAERNWIFHKNHSKTYAEFLPPERESKLEKLWKSMKGIIIAVAFGMLFVIVVRRLAKK